MNDELILRPLTEADLDAAAALEMLSFSDHWSRDGIKAAVENTRTGYTMGAFLNGKLAGYLIAQTVLDEGELLRIAAAPEERRRGIGRALLRKMLADHPETQVWRLDVRAGNEAAKKLYVSEGFTAAACNKNYYTDPREDGFLMMREAAPRA